MCRPTAPFWSGVPRHPLLARLPAFEDPDWRTGHFKRLVPRGYMRTLMRGTNEIEDPELARTVKKLRKTRSVKRFEVLVAGLGG